MGVSSTEIIDPNIALYVYRNTLEKGKFEPMKCLVSEDAMFIQGSKNPFMRLKFYSEDIKYIVSFKVFVKKSAFSEERYSPYGEMSNDYMCIVLEGGKCYTFEFAVKYPSGERETIKRTCDLREDSVSFGDIKICLFGGVAGKLKGGPFLEVAAKRIKELNYLLPEGFKIKAMHVFSTNPGSISHIGGSPSNGILPVTDKLFMGFPTYEENARTITDVVTHELGHQLLDLASADQKVDLHQLFERAKKGAVLGLFCDGSYSPEERLGHPWDNEEELFASVFTVLTNYPEAFRARMAEEFYSNEQRSLIRDVANYVHIRCYGRPFFDQ